MQALREYETIYILKPDIADDAMSTVQERLSDVMDKQGAKILRFNVWGKKKLAFEVAKNPKGVYVQLSFLAGPDAIKEIERNLRLIEPVVRYQTIKVAETVDVDKRLAEQAAEDQARADAEAKAKAEAEAKAEADAEAAAKAKAEAEASEGSIRAKLAAGRKKAAPAEAAAPETKAAIVEQKMGIDKLLYKLDRIHKRV